MFKYLKHVLFAFSLFSFFLSGSVQACSVCGMGDPLVSAGDSRPDPGQLRIALDNQFLTATALSDDNPANRESLEQYTIKPVAVYSPVEFLNLVLGVPLTYKNWKLNDASTGTNVDNAQPFGLGDIDFGTRWFLFQKTSLKDQMRHSLSLTAGITFPAGANDLTGSSGTRIDEHAQIGTGSWGPYLGLSYAFHKDPWNFSVYGALRYHTVNSYDYQYGLGILGGIAGQYRIRDPFAVTLSIDARYAYNDTLAGVAQVNTGGLVLGVTPGFIYNIVDELWLKGFVQIPVWVNLSGEQTVGLTYSLTVQYAFHI